MKPQLVVLVVKRICGNKTTMMGDDDVGTPTRATVVSDFVVVLLDFAKKRLLTNDAHNRLLELSIPNV